MRALFDAAAIVVHPSRYEGFGYPIVEAMGCGTPVITTTSSSLPEAGGDAAVLVEPDDAAGIAEAVEDVLRSHARREQMRQRGFEHVRHFEGDQLGRATIDAYRAAVSSAPIRDAETKRRLAIRSSFLH